MDLHDTGRKAGSDARQPAGVSWPSEVASTADADVDAIIGALIQLPGVPVSGQVAVFEQIHDDLLADLDAGAD